MLATGTVELSNVIVRGAAAAVGGVVHMNAGTLRVSSSVFDAPRAAYGAAVFASGGRVDFTDVDIVQSQTTYGGTIYVCGTTEFEGVRVSITQFSGAGVILVDEGNNSEGDVADFECEECLFGDGASIDNGATVVAVEGTVGSACVTGVLGTGETFVGGTDLLCTTVQAAACVNPENGFVTSDVGAPCTYGCVSGFYWDAISGVCVACTECDPAAAEYQILACAATADAACGTCDIGFNGVITDWATCDYICSHGHYQAGNGDCITCSACSANEYPNQ